jgi:hypothetical protein
MPAAESISPCIPEISNLKTVRAATTEREYEPIKPLITAERMAEIVSRQPLQSWAEMKAQINRSLGRPLDSE